MKHYNIPEALSILMIGRTKLYQELNSGRLAAKKIGTRTIITSEAIDAWFETLPSYDPAELDREKKDV